MKAWNQGVDVGVLAKALSISRMTVYNLAHRIPACEPRRQSAKARRAQSKAQGQARTPSTPIPAARPDLRRFETFAAVPEAVQPLPPDSSAIARGGTVYPSTVVSAAETKRILISGHNNRKIGAKVEKGAWSGMPIFVVTLEERATCPRSCAQWFTCYGNSMHLARRHAHGPLFEKRLELELKLAAIENPAGYVVRLHVLGDFYSTDYVAFWRRMLTEIPELRVFGYTANDPTSPDANEAMIGRSLLRLRWHHADRFALRWSRRTSSPGGTTVIDYMPESPRVPEGIVCPAQMHATACCSTCGLCWAPAASGETIVFVKHGRQHKGSGELPQ